MHPTLRQQLQDAISTLDEPGMSAGRMAYAVLGISHATLHAIRDEAAEDWTGTTNIVQRIADATGWAITIWPRAPQANHPVPTDDGPLRPEPTAPQ